MSTDKQDMSVNNQRAAIAAYARMHNMRVAQSYVDEGRSGLDVEGRPALQRLLSDVQNHCTGCVAILVLDVSRWGRFQNVDESAHYEFLCTQHGMRVIYVAEPFGDGDGPLQAVLKSLKRSMAAEYSRELSVKVFAGQARLARNGFAMGGPTVYGLRRMLVDASGAPRCVLEAGERKSISTDRVRLTLGPPDEVAAVRWMFKQAAAGATNKEIAERLNKRGKRNAKGELWSMSAINCILNDLRYTGTIVFGRPQSRALIKPNANEPPREPICIEHAIPAIVTQELFRAANAHRMQRALKLSDDDLLSAARNLWRKKGRITTRLLNADPDTPSTQVYLHRFGSLRVVYRRIGYTQDRYLGYGDVRDRIQVWLPSVVGYVCEVLEDDGSSVIQKGRTLQIDDTWSVSFHLMQSSSAGHPGTVRWMLPRLRDPADVLVGIRMSVKGDHPLDYLVLPAVSTKTWPDVIQERPGAGASFYLFKSLQVLRELASLTRGVSNNARG